MIQPPPNPDTDAPSLGERLSVLLAVDPSWRARCPTARRPQAGAPPAALPMRDSGLDPSSGLQEGARVVGDVHRQFTRTATSRSTSAWCAWPRISAPLIRWSTAGHFGNTTAITPRRCRHRGTPDRGRRGAARRQSTRRVDLVTYDGDNAEPVVLSGGPRFREPPGQTAPRHRGRHGYPRARLTMRLSCYRSLHLYRPAQGTVSELLAHCWVRISPTGGVLSSHRRRSARPRGGGRPASALPVRAALGDRKASRAEPSMSG